MLCCTFACGPIYPDQKQPASQPSGTDVSGPPGGDTEDPGSQDPAEPEPGEPSQPSQPSQPQPKVSGLAPEMQTLLDSHNRVRAQHCAGPLTWSTKLAQSAQAWAVTLRDRNCAFEHSETRYGENLAGGSSGALDPEGVTAMWYDEVKQYNFQRPAFSMATGHFTQVVWRGTTQLGCGRATCRNGMELWVCQYDPAGNMQGQFPSNVLSRGCK